MVKTGEVLRTARVRLRFIEKRDLDDILAIYSDPLCMRYYKALRTRERMQEWFDFVFAAYEANGYGLFAVERLSDGVFLGICGFLQQDVDGDALVEIGYLFKSMHWHRGYASESAIACRDYGFNVLKQPKLISLIRPENAPSRAVSTRVGMTVERTTQRVGWTHLVYSINAPSGG
ncbi:MAG TPA: GNAT family N-acetyltransferase [Candidatus Eremiobacteraceae bacterium]|nr:GNAT family N-acetyltransferase [Candidatus Eremiobacteraceae bacterium]